MDKGQIGPGGAQEESTSAGTPSLRRRLLSGSAWAAGGRLVAAFAVFAANLLLARLLSPEDLGAYFLALSIVSVGSLLSLLGMDQAVVRFVPESIGLDQFGRARRVLGKVLTLGILGTLGVGATFLLFGYVIEGSLFRAPALVAVTGLVAGWMMVTALQVLLGASFLALQDVRLYGVFYSAAGGVLLAASLGVLWLVGYQATLAPVLLLAVGSGFASSLLAGWLLHRKMAVFPSSGATSQVVKLNEIMRVGWPLLVANLTLFALGQADLWILGAFRPQEEVAIYGAATRVVLLVSMPILIFNSVLTPLIAEMYAQGRKRELERTLRAAATMAGIPALFMVAGFVLLGGPILGLVFGDYYRQGATVLALLSIAQLFSIWSGVCGAALSMTGHQTTMMVITVAGSLVVIVAGIGVVNSYGATGVAVAASAGVIVTNLAYWLAARRKSSMWTHAGFSGFSDLIRAAKRIAG